MNVRGPRLSAVVFDAGGVLIDETRIYTEWAEWLGVSPFTFFAVLGAVIQERRDHLQAFERVRPGFQLTREETAREGAGRPNAVLPGDLYPDVPACLDRLRGQGFTLGVAANQPARVEQALREMGLPFDFVAVSESWGVEKPAAGFFQRVVQAVGRPAGEIAYVGDRVDNDVLPALAAGMTAIFLARGPWGSIQGTWPEAEQAHIRVASLAQLPEALAALTL